jgi:DNA polymerase phi
VTRYLGFQLFTLLLPVLPADQVPTLFSANFMRCMVNNLGKEQTLLHPIASKCLTNVSAPHLPASPCALL